MRSGLFTVLKDNLLIQKTAKPFLRDPIVVNYQIKKITGGKISVSTWEKTGADLATKEWPKISITNFLSILFIIWIVIMGIRIFNQVDISSSNKKAYSNSEKKLDEAAQDFRNQIMEDFTLRSSEEP
tara:strand:- start:1215 stop:1595 length:381 start_codon:yes stop_codon:yes gene_type:complete